MRSYFQRKRNLYNPASKEPFRISRSRIDLFLECPRCFYLDRRLGLDRLEGPGFALNSAVDALLKNEFDLLRKDKKAHALMATYRIDAIPFDHPDLPVWRDDVRRYVGISTLHRETNLEICGIIDDVWVNPQGELHIVDYKATSTSKEISLEDEFKQGYKKQMEVYQWLFRRLGFRVSDAGYFVFANATKNRNSFDGKLEFELSIVSHAGDDSWVEKTVYEIHACLDGKDIPPASPLCQFCGYRSAIGKYGI